MNRWAGIYSRIWLCAGTAAALAVVMISPSASGPPTASAPTGKTRAARGKPVHLGRLKAARLV